MHTATRSAVDLDALGALFPDSVARAADLVHIGLASSSVYARCRPGGPWQRLLPGIVLLTNASPTRRQLITAALTYGGKAALLTRPDAVQLHGLKAVKPHGPVHVLIADTKQVRSDSAVRVERTTRLPEPVIRSGVRIAPITRAVLDTCRRLHSMDDTRALIAEAVQRGLTTPTALGVELSRGSNRGSALPRRVLKEIGVGVRSTAESWGFRLMRNSGLPQPRWNVAVRDQHGNLLGVVDAWWDDVAMAWEIDSEEFHSSPTGYANTVRRGARLTAAGLVVVHTLPARIRREPRAVLAELRAAYEQAQRRPRPPVVADPVG